MARLRERRGEIGQAVLTRIYGVSDPTEAAQPEYVEGLRAAVPTALDYGLAAIERVDGTLPVPPELLAQARVAARSGVSLDTVLRRYFAGYTLLGDFVMGTAEEDGLLGAGALQSLLRAQANLFERLAGAVTEEYTRESERRLDSAEARRADLVERLLAGELVDAVDLSYQLDAQHIAAIAAGRGAAEALRDLAKALDCRLLLIHREEETAWAWLGSRRRIDPVELQRLASKGLPAEACMAIGEPGNGLAGWRLTHRQARAALPIAQRGRQPVVRYADMALLASVLQDDLLVTSLRELYLAPLAAERDGGRVLCDTLRAFFAAERNTSSAAAALGVSRRTVANRLRSIEAKLDRPLGAAMADIEAALRLQDLDAMPESPAGLL